MGFYMLILLAGLQSIPADLYEAAAIDGANPWQSFSKITMPLLMPTMVVVLVLSLIRAVQVFDIVFAFTGGGPGTATLYLVQYIYNYGFSSPNKQFGLAAAASLLMAGVLVVLTVVQLVHAAGGELNMSSILKFLRLTKGRKRLDFTDVLSYVYLVMGVLIMFVPIVWLVFSSFKTSGEIVKFPPRFAALPPGDGGGGGL